MNTITKFVPLDTFSPDLGVLNNPGLVGMRNLIPLGVDGFASPSLFATAHSLTSTALGMGTHVDTTDVFYGAAGKLRQVVVGVSDTDRSGAAYTAEAMPVGWSFLSFGTDILAFGGRTQRPQYRAATGTANFADLLDATTLARYDLCPRYGCAVGQHILIGNIRDLLPAPDVDYPDRVWLSAVNNARRFGDASTDPTLLTDYQDLYDDYGHITGLSGANDYAYIFKHRCIYRMDFGGPFGLTFKPFSVGTGCIAPHSIVPVDGDVYFWSNNGPAVVRAGGTVVMLANTGLTRSLLAVDQNNLELDYIFNESLKETQGWYCPFTRTVNWSYASTLDYIGGSVLATLVYAVDTGRWGLLKWGSDESVTGGYPLGAATAFQTGSLNWAYGRAQYLISGGNKLLAYDGTTRAAAHATTPWLICRELLGDKYTTAKITRIRPRVRSAGEITFSLTLTGREDLVGGQNTPTVIASSSGSLDASGYVSCETEIAQAFTIRIDIDSGDGYVFVYELDGLDVEFDVGSTKGP